MKKKLDKKALDEVSGAQIVATGDEYMGDGPHETPLTTFVCSKCHHKIVVSSISQVPPSCSCGGRYIAATTKHNGY